MPRRAWAPYPFSKFDILLRVRSMSVQIVIEFPRYLHADSRDAMRKIL